MLDQSICINYNKIKQCLIGLPSDYYWQEACEISKCKIWNNKQLWQIYNELLNSKTNEHAGKLVVGAWQPIGMLESVCVCGWG